MKDKFSEEVAKTLDKLANRETDNKFTNFINKKKFPEACDVAISVLSLLEEEKKKKVKPRVK